MIHEIEREDGWSPYEIDNNTVDNISNLNMKYVSTKEFRINMSKYRPKIALCLN